MLKTTKRVALVALLTALAASGLAYNSASSRNIAVDEGWEAVITAYEARLDALPEYLEDSALQSLLPAHELLAIKSAVINWGYAANDASRARAAAEMDLSAAAMISAIRHNPYLGIVPRIREFGDRLERLSADATAARRSYTDTVSALNRVLERPLVAEVAWLSGINERRDFFYGLPMVVPAGD